MTEYKNYEKTHRSKKAMDAHIDKIAQRGGQWKVEGNKLLYRFPVAQNETKSGKYDTMDKKIAFIRKKGNIITFKNKFYPRGTSDTGFNQIIVTGIDNPKKTGAIKIIGKSFDSPWFASVAKLIDAIDWKSMESMHS